MSGFCLLAELGGRRADGRALDRMVGAAVDRTPERVGRRRTEELAAAWLAVETTPGAEPESVPVVSPDGRFTLLADVRLDNREELRRELAAESEGGSDAELLLSAFLAWGTESPRRLVGDFSFAIWDHVERRLFAARDALGVRCLYYAVVDDRLTVATGVGSVVAGLRSSPAFNRPLMEDFLAVRLDRWVGETAYQSVHRLPQGYALEVDLHGPRLSRYWRLGEQSIRYRRRSDYVDHFRELLATSLSTRLRSPSPVGMLVSGGVDSSSLACLAARLRDRGEIDVELKLFSLVFDATLPADEREYLAAVAERCSAFQLTRIPADDAWGLKEFGRDHGYPLDEPEISLGRALWMRALSTVREGGCRVALWGNGGDQAMGGDAYAFPLNLLDVPLRRWRSEARYFRRKGGPPAAWEVARRWLRELAPPTLLSALRRLRGPRPDLLARLREPSRAGVADHLPPPELDSRSARRSYRLLTSGAYSAALAEVDHQARWSGVELRYPYLDRRLVDFLLAVPAELRFEDGLEKTLVRAALGDDLPPIVRARSTYAHFSDLIVRGLERESGRVDRLLADPRIVSEGLVPPGVFEAAWLCYRGDRRARYKVHGLAKALCLETWLRYHLLTPWRRLLRLGKQGLRPR